jgi:hypothetical protein
MLVCLKEALTAPTTTSPTASLVSTPVTTSGQILLYLGEGGSHAEVCCAFDVCRTTVLNVRARVAEGGGCSGAPQAARPLR